MFWVQCISPLSEDWEALNARIREVAGRKVAVFSTGSNHQMEHNWSVKEFEQAVELKKRLDEIETTTTTFREM